MFLNEEEEWICDEFFCKLSYIIQYYCLKTNYFSIYENGWPGSITTLVQKNTYWIRNIELSFKSVADKLFIRNILIKRNSTIEMGENIDNIAIYKYDGMMKTHKNNN